MGPNTFIFYFNFTGFTQVTKMKMLNVEKSEIQTLDTIKIPSIILCISKCRNLNNPSSGTSGGTTAPPPVPALGTSTLCNTIGYDDSSSTCQLAFITGETKWASRNAAPSKTNPRLLPNCLDLAPRASAPTVPALILSSTERLPGM